MISVLVVDDHPLVRTGLLTLLANADDVEVAGEASDGAEALRLVAHSEPDVVLMDLSMPGIDGVAATERLRSDHPDTRVLVLTSFADDDRVRAALAAGAVGYLLKTCTPDELVAGVRAAAAGQHPLDPRVAGALLAGLRPAEEEQPEAAAGLSAREVQVLRLASTGMANKQIARSLGIAERTVKVHLGNVFRRIGVADRTSAALWARDNLPDTPA